MYILNIVRAIKMSVNEITDFISENYYKLDFLRKTVII